MSYQSPNQGYYSGGYDEFDDSEAPLLHYLGLAVLVLGLASYGLSFVRMSDGQGAEWGVRLAVLAALAAGLGLIPRQHTHHQVVAVLAAAGFLDAVAVRIGASGGWALTVIAVLNGLQSLAAIGGLLQAHPADEHEATSTYQAYVDYWAQMQGYGLYPQATEPPEMQQRSGQGQAMAQVDGQAVDAAAARAARPAAAQAAGYGEFATQHDPEHTALIERIPVAPEPQSGQAGLPNVGRAQTQAPTQRYGEPPGSPAARPTGSP